MLPTRTLFATVTATSTEGRFAPRRGSYACPEAEIGVISYSWQHTFEEIVRALLDAGLQVTSLREYPYLSFQWFPFMVRGADGYWRMPAGRPDLPLMFSITAKKGAC